MTIHRCPGVIASAACFVLILPVSTTSQSLNRSDLLTRIDAVVAMKSEHVVGVSIGVMKDDEVIVSKGFGTRIWRTMFRRRNARSTESVRSRSSSLQRRSCNSSTPVS